MAGLGRLTQEQAEAWGAWEADGFKVRARRATFLETLDAAIGEAERALLNDLYRRQAEWLRARLDPAPG